MSTRNTQASFPEVGYGYVPDGGSIFFLSRLEGEIGTFLALTGYKLVDSDLVRLKLTFDMIQEDPEMPIAKRVFGKNFYESLNDDWKKWPEVYKEYHEKKNQYGPN